MPAVRLAIPGGCLAYVALPRYEMGRGELRAALAVRHRLLVARPRAYTPEQLQLALPLEGAADLLSLHANLLRVGWLGADETAWLDAECRLLHARLQPWSADRFRAALPAALPWRWGAAAVGRRRLEVRGGVVVAPTLTVLRAALVGKMRENLVGQLQKARAFCASGQGPCSLLAVESPLAVLRWSGYVGQYCVVCHRLTPGRCCRPLQRRPPAATAVLRQLRLGVREGWVTWACGTFRLVEERRLRWPRVVAALRPYGFRFDAKRRTGSHVRWTLNSTPRTTDEEKEARMRRQWDRRIVDAVLALCPMPRAVPGRQVTQVPHVGAIQPLLAEHGMGENVLVPAGSRIYCTQSAGQRFCALKGGCHSSSNRGYLSMRGQELVYRCFSAGCAGRDLVVAPFFGAVTAAPPLSCGGGAHCL